MGLALSGGLAEQGKQADQENGQADISKKEISAVKNQLPIVSVFICDFSPTQPECNHGNLKNGRTFLRIQVDSEF